MINNVTLSAQDRAGLAGLMVRICDLSRDAKPGDCLPMYARGSRSISLTEAAGHALREATELLQTVDRWNQAYPTDVIHQRIMRSILDSHTDDEAVDRLMAGLDADCADLRAYVAFSGFHIPPESKIRFGKHILSVIGPARFEEEVIARLDGHLASSLEDEEDWAKERDRYRELLKKYPNVPILVVEYFGSVDGARERVEPIADRVALFMQVCIGALTDRRFDNPLIVDYRGRFTGDYMALMPVMTKEFGSLSFPNLRGNPWGCSLTLENLKTLEELGVLSMADRFVDADVADDAIDSLLVRAMCAFADGERAIGSLSRITAYVTAAEIFFSRKGMVTKTATTGVAAAVARNDKEFEETVDLARFVYRQRSEAVHEGLEPTATFIARKLALGAILGMITRRDMLTNRKQIQSWLDGYLAKRNA